MRNTTCICRPVFRGTLRSLSAAAAAFAFSLTIFSQSPSPSPAADSGGGYSVTASTEIGARWVDVNGNENKFRSDLNYRNGFRIFDSSILIQDEGSGFKAFDSALFQGSGWGSDPSGFFRANLERTGSYKFDANIRRIGFFNNLNNHAIGATRINYHNYDTNRNLGDFDLTLFPESPTFRVRIGGGYNVQGGTFTYTSRSSEAFPVTAFADSKAYDFRLGADGEVLGFNLSGTYGFRKYRNRTEYLLLEPNEGDQTGGRFILEMERLNPIDGRTHFGVLNLHRTFAKKFDITAKILHSRTSTEFDWDEFDIYRSGTALTREEWTIPGDTNRPQTRADLGMTWRITDAFRLSNTFTYDGFNINGGNFYSQIVTSNTITPTIRSNYNVTRYRRYTNTFEGDYQFNDRVGVNAGYRYSNRKVRLLYIPIRLAGSSVSGQNEDAENSTNTFLAGTRVKPLKNWAIYADIEAGKADTVFTRAGNADFTNFRVRSIMRFNKVSANVSFIDKENEIPTDTTTSSVPRITDVSSRIFAASIDWNPVDKLNLTGGYNYVHLTSRATVDFSNLADVLSEYFVRENYFFIDAGVRAHKRLSFFGSYRWNKDRGHGDRPVPALSDISYILGSYPFNLKMPEVKASIRINRYIDWNLGYQYYDYKEDPVPQAVYGLPKQNYSAHMPYTSVRIYLGRGAGER